MTNHQNQKEEEEEAAPYPFRIQNSGNVGTPKTKPEPLKQNPNP